MRHKGIKKKEEKMEKLTKNERIFVEKAVAVGDIIPDCFACPNFGWSRMEERDDCLVGPLGNNPEICHIRKEIEKRTKEVKNEINSQR
jgi:hypothetical protein